MHEVRYASQRLKFDVLDVYKKRQFHRGVITDGTEPTLQADVVQRVESRALSLVPPLAHTGKNIEVAYVQGMGDGFKSVSIKTC